MSAQVVVKVKRGAGEGKPSFVEDFIVTLPAPTSLIHVLGLIQRNPLNAKGVATTPLAWESFCHQGSCGSCLMVVNGKPELACSYMVEAKPLVLNVEPLDKFPIISDLIVDKSRLSDDFSLWEGKVSLNKAETVREVKSLTQPKALYSQLLSACHSCGACLEVCPRYDREGAFVGSAVLNEMARALSHSLVPIKEDQAFDFLMGEMGVENCGQAQNCQSVCPASIPLLRSIATLEREVVKEGFINFFKRD